MTLRTLLLLLAFAATTPAEVEAQTSEPLRLVVLGSSTAQGAGATDVNRSWVQLFRDECRSVVPECQVINLARGGYTTFHILQDDADVSETEPIPDRGRNISEALRLQPDGIIINLPSNDASRGTPVSKQLANYALVIATADAAGVPVWITTTQPRNLSETGRQNLMAMRDSTFARFGDRAIDFWTGLADADGSMLPSYDSGDGVHLNDRAHALLFEHIRSHGIPQQLAARSGR